jgi:uncharacterized protein YaaQ
MLYSISNNPRKGEQMTEFSPDQLLILNVTEPQTGKLIKELNDKGIHFTVIDSRSGMFQEPINCLIIGFNEVQKAGLLELIRACCQHYLKYIPTQGPARGELASLPMMEAQFGGALVQILNVERFEQL